MADFDAYDVPIVEVEFADANIPAQEIAPVVFAPPAPPLPYPQKFNPGQDVP